MSEEKDWIDEWFENIEAADKPTWTMKSSLLKRLADCRYEYKVHDAFEDEIISSDLTIDRFRELSTTFEMNKLDVRYDYAPSQRALAKWIKRIANLE